MADVAKVAAVSQSTVSLVLGGATGTRISHATRMRVIAAARELEYHQPARPSVLQRHDDVGASSARLTMMDVARAAGVSQTTVSFILNDVFEARLSNDTRQRVLDAAHQLGYLPTRRRARRDKSAAGAIVFLVDEMSTDPWMALALDGLREKAWERGATVHTIVSGANAEVAQAALDSIGSERFSGLIVGAINLRALEPMRFPIGVPTVLFNCYAGDPLTAVLPAEFQGGRAATRRLLSSGHKRIGYINGEQWMDASRDRLKGYRRALTEAGLPFDPALVRQGNWEPSAGYDHTRALMKLENPPTAVFCANDLMAFGCYQALLECGFAIPRDVAVIGYDDRDIATFLHPPLTTIQLPLFDMGVEAAEQLFALIDGVRQTPRRIKVPGKLIERSSI